MKTLKVLTLLVCSLMLGCGNDDPPIDPPPPDPECYDNPQTHLEIINSCFDDPSIVKIEKNPVLPLLNPDGTLPPLP